MHRFLGGAVRHQFGAAEQALAAHIANNGVLGFQPFQPFHQVSALFQDVVQQAFFLDDANVFQTRRRASRAAAKGGNVAEVIHRIVRVFLEHVEHFFRGHGAGNRSIARRHAFGHGHEIRLNAIILIAKPGAGAAQTTDHFVDMQQDIVFLTNLLHPLPIAFGRGDHTTTSGYRFQHDRTDGFRAFAQDHVFNRVGRRDAIAFGIRVLVAVLRTMGHRNKARRKGAVLRCPLRLARGGQGGDRGAVVVALAIQDLVFDAAVFLVRDLAYHLVNLLVGFRPRVGIINPAHPRHLGQQLFGKQRAGDRPGRACEIVQLDQLVAHRIGNAFTPVTDIDGPHTARHRIQKLAPLGVPDMDALAFDNDQRVLRFVFLVGRKVMPDMGAVGLDHPFQIVGVKA